MKAIKSALSSRRPSTASSVNSSSFSSGPGDMEAGLNASTSSGSTSLSRKNTFIQKILGVTGSHSKQSFKFKSTDSLGYDSSENVAVPAISVEDLQSLTRTVESTDITPSNTEIMPADFSPSISRGFIPLSELEGFCLDFVSASLSTLPEYVHIKNHPANDLLTSAISSSVYQFVKDKLPAVNLNAVGSTSSLKPGSKSSMQIDTALLTKIINTRLNVFATNIIRKRRRLMKESRRTVGNIGFASETGTRRSNEDCHVTIPYFNDLFGRTAAVVTSSSNCPPVSYFAVFDGHGGPECASYIGRYLHTVLARHPRFHESTQRAIKDSFIKTNKMWAKNVESTEGLSPLAGSTGVVTVVKNRTLYIAWVGDSSAILFLKDGFSLDFVLPHKPMFESERKRIMKLGGSIENDRVNGALAVTRSFGDIQHGCIIPEADLMEYTLTGNEHFLILACDGLTDVMDASQIYEIVKEKLDETPNIHPDFICNALVQEALARGSTDNVTVVFVDLKTPKVFTEEELHIDIPALHIAGQQTPTDRGSRPTSGKKTTKHLSLKESVPPVPDLGKGMAELKLELKKMHETSKISTSQPVLYRPEIPEEEEQQQQAFNQITPESKKEQPAPVNQETQPAQRRMISRRNSDSASRPRSMIEEKELEKLKTMPENGLYPIASSKISTSLFSNNISQTRNNISELQALAQLSKQMFPPKQ